MRLEKLQTNRSRTWTRMAMLAALLGGVGFTVAETAVVPPHTPKVGAIPKYPPGMFQPPSPTTIPDDEMGAMIRKGQRIFMHTGELAPQFVGNRLACANCHLDAGRMPDSAPMWAAFVSYPAYRSKNQHVNTLAERIQGCFTYSMNGKAPPLGDPVLVALQSYFQWLATGAEVGSKMMGSGYPKLDQPEREPDYFEGQKVYAQNCALCHGANGEGQRSSDGKQVFPPLWGPESFNWGAGMHRIGTAAAFIKANMPFSRGGLLSTQQAWDVALFMNSHERPQDPRFAGSVDATREQFHASDDSMYGRRFNGHLLGSGR
ncbi:c-type cytochrome [Piscinibacter sakaiensis]|uniref:c-type cytochrome n=1 Tax=Piscinibacter sakaiensis TaxID=1547922 RepID=UPI003AAACC6F